MSGSIDMIVFPEAFRRIGEKVKLEVPVLVKAGVRIEEGANPKITAAEILPLEEAKVPVPRAIRIRVVVDTAGGTTADGLHHLFTERKGEAKVLVAIEREGDCKGGMEADG